MKFKGTDGKYHKFNVLRILAHEMGHLFGNLHSWATTLGNLSSKTVVRLSKVEKNMAQDSSVVLRSIGPTVRPWTKTENATTAKVTAMTAW